ncbi:MAG: hypothetical protein ACYTGC_18400, partial [Planctomycetota bacterium]
MTPKPESDQEQPSLLMAELRWFVRLRWLAGLAVIATTISNALGQGWSAGLHTRFLAVGAAILGYNVVLAALVRKLPDRGGRVPAAAMAWIQVVPDLAALTLLVMWTG